MVYHGSEGTLPCQRDDRLDRAWLGERWNVGKWWFGPRRTFGSRRLGEHTDLISVLETETDRFRCSWPEQDNIMRALQKLPSVPSKALVALLSHVTQYHLAPTEVGSTGLTAPPSLVDFLKTYLTVTVSPAMHKQALKEGLTKVEQVQSVLNLMVDWLEVVGKDAQGQGLVGWENDEVTQKASIYSVEGVSLRWHCHQPELSNPNLDFFWRHSTACFAYSAFARCALAIVNLPPPRSSPH